MPTPDSDRRRAPTRHRNSFGPLAALLLVMPLAGGACVVDEGRDLAAPRSDQTIPPFRTSVAQTDPGVTLPPVEALDISTDGWEPNTEIPTRFTCDGEGVRPEIRWSAPASTTAEIVLMVSDGQGDRQLIVSGMEPDTVSLPAGPIEAGTVVLGDLDRNDWNPPCPAEAQREDYYLSVYALDEEVGLEVGVDPVDAVNSVDRLTVARGVQQAFADG